MVNGVNKFGIFFRRKLEFSYTKIYSNCIKVHKFTVTYSNLIPIISMDNNWKVLMLDDNGELVEITLPYSYQFDFKVIVTRMNIEPLDIAELYRTMRTLNSKFRLFINEFDYEEIPWLYKNIFYYDGVSFLVKYIEDESVPYSRLKYYSLWCGSISHILNFLRKSRMKRPYGYTTKMLSRMLIH